MTRGLLHTIGVTAFPYLTRKRGQAMKAELLAPAGSYESMTAAVMAGADAVYMGGSRFGARAYADNPDQERLKEALDFCHLRGVKLYLTVNTLLKEQELSELYEFLSPLYEHGLDAVIVQDFGVLRYLRRQFPLLDIHASTQMTNQGADGAKLLEGFGVKRVVTSRELTLSEIRRIHESTRLEIESFVHGALCYCYSGQCLLSSVIGGRSGNRGRCAQPCRLPYDFSPKKKGTGQYLLSPKDICTLEILPEILKSGVYSLKIEGRMKRPEYTAGVVRIYRKYLDLLENTGSETYVVDPKDVEELMDLYNRGGFSQGYYKTRGDKAMMSTVRPNHYGTQGARILSVKKNMITASALEDLNQGDVLESATLSSSVKKGTSFTIKAPRDLKAVPGSILHRTQNARLLKELSAYQDLGFRKEKINGKLILSKGKPVILSLAFGNISIRLEGPCVQEAKNMALTFQVVDRQMRKTGATEFTFDHLEIRMEEDCFLPMQAFNELRRQGILLLQEQILKTFRRESVPRLLAASFDGRTYPSKKPELKALAFCPEQAKALISVEGVSAVYLEAHMFFDHPEKFQPLADSIKAAGKECFLAMPCLFRQDMKERFLEADMEALLTLPDGFLVRNLEEVAFLRDHVSGKKLIADASLYSYSREARLFLAEQGFSGDTAPLELNRHELKERGMENSELFVYGRIPLMISSQCVKRTSGSCNHKKEFTVLRDRKGKEFPVWNECGYCYTILYNTAPHFLLEDEKEILTLNPGSLRLAFTTETPEETAKIAECFVKQFVLGQKTDFRIADFTRGHFKRGVE